MNIAYYISKNIQFNPLVIKKYYYDKSPINNFFILYRNPITEMSFTEISCLNFYSMNWMKGEIVFDSIESYLENKEDILCEPSIVCDPIGLESIDKKLFKDFKNILLYQNDNIERIPYEEL